MIGDDDTMFNPLALGQLLGSLDPTDEWCAHPRPDSNPATHADDDPGPCPSSNAALALPLFAIGLAAVTLLPLSSRRIVVDFFLSPVYLAGFGGLLCLACVRACVRAYA